MDEAYEGVGNTQHSVLCEDEMTRWYEAILQTVKEFGLTPTCHDGVLAQYDASSHRTGQEQHSRIS
ncbi:unnamed protein product [Hydatigera taeniaeformis]|uniref:PH domain-containing protein n=1 Tax=Hydatigena taeniaeformis TaxID=6205 RepID=A0A0R3X9I8_HYDTA|nr:unnamed protein product [Hydatigera taeniaeformis]